VAAGGEGNLQPAWKNRGRPAEPIRVRFSAGGSAAALYERLYCARGENENRIKIGAQIHVSVRRVRVCLASSYPYAALFTQIIQHLRAGPIAAH
jgi:hypothetical protein